MLDYQITKSHMLNKWSWLPDFEDRYHDVWEMMLRYPPPSDVNPLTAFKRMWSSWYTWTKERRREATAESIVEFLDPDDERYTSAHDNGIPDNTLEVMIRRIIPQLSTQSRAVGAMRLAGYSLSEIAAELDVSDSRVSDLWQGVVDSLKQIHTPNSNEPSLLDKAKEKAKARALARYYRNKDKANAQRKLLYQQTKNA